MTHTEPDPKQPDPADPRTPDPSNPATTRPPAPATDTREDDDDND
jgi:hypothetical protein